MPPLVVSIRGVIPAPQGSKKVVGQRKNGSAILKEVSNRLPEWRSRIRAAALDLNVEMLLGPVCAHFEFLFDRPKSHFTSKGELRPDAPTWHSVKPDLSKLHRSSEEELSKLLIEDDCRICMAVTEKRYCNPGESCGVVITLQPINEIRPAADSPSP
jgi:hypothetical protein